MVNHSGGHPGDGLYLKTAPLKTDANGLDGTTGGPATRSNDAGPPQAPRGLDVS